MRDDPFGEDRPRPTAVHVVGEELAALSVADLDERVAVLEAEIARVKADRDRKETSRAAAAAAFKV